MVHHQPEALLSPDGTMSGSDRLNRFLLVPSPHLLQAWQQTVSGCTPISIRNRGRLFCLFFRDRPVMVRIQTETVLVGITKTTSLPTSHPSSHPLPTSHHPSRNQNRNCHYGIMTRIRSVLGESWPGGLYLGLHIAMHTLEFLGLATAVSLEWAELMVASVNTPHVDTKLAGFSAV